MRSRSTYTAMNTEKLTVDAELQNLQRESFNYFFHETNPANGLVIDKTQANWPASIAATGLALARSILASANKISFSATTVFTGTQGTVLSRADETGLSCGLARSLEIRGAASKREVVSWFLAVPRSRSLNNASRQQGTTPHRTHRLATRGGIGRERRHPFNIESGARCRSCACDSQQRIGRRGRRTGGWGYVDGCRRVRVCPLTGRHRTGRTRA